MVSKGEGKVSRVLISTVVIHLSTCKCIASFSILAGQNQLRDAEQYLSQAQWSVMQAVPPAPPSLHSQLQRRLGLLAVARGELQVARKHFAEDVSHLQSYNKLHVAHGFLLP